VAERNEQQEPVALREIVTRRVFDAPPSLLWEAWTDPDRIAKWWGPVGFTTTTHSMDMRPGGVWLFTMHGPDGVNYPNRVIFREVVPGKKLSYVQDDDDRPVGEQQIQFETEVLFEELQGKTMLTLRAVFPSAAAKQYVIDQFGAVQGGVEHLNRLAEHVTGRHVPALVFSLPDEKTILYAREFFTTSVKVFDALTQPDLLRQWWGCDSMKLIECEVDLREGGQWRLTLETEAGERYPFKGQYRVLRRPDFLEQAFVFDVEGLRDYESIESITLMEMGSRTVIKGRIQHQSQQSRDAQLQSGMEFGLAASYDRLEKLVSVIH